MSYGLASSSQKIQGIRNPAIIDIMDGIMLPIRIVDLAAAAVAVHAQLLDNATHPVTANITSPVHPRSLVITFGASWGGGTVTVAGTDQFGRSITDTFAVNAGGTTEGTKIFKTVTSITWPTTGSGAGGHTIDVATSTKIGLGLPLKAAWGLCFANGVAELATFDATYHAVTPSTSPEGTVDFLLIVPVDVRMAQNLNLISLTA